jgi:hypothetical protein
MRNNQDEISKKNVLKYRKDRLFNGSFDNNMKHIFSDRLTISAKVNDSRNVREIHDIQ